ncbi:MAG: AsmA family protein [Desulfobulbus sp.]
MKKGRLLKTGIALAVLIAVVVVGAIVAVQSINLDQFKEMLAAQVKKSTGRDLAINGPVEIKLGIVPRIVVNDVTLSNPPGSSRPEMVKIKRFELEVALRHLLEKQLMVNRLILASPDVLIETEAKGPGNLDFSVPGEEKQTAASPEESKGESGFSFACNELKITNGKFTLYDRATKKSEQITIEQFNLRSDKKDPSLLGVQLLTTVREHKIDLTGSLGGIDSVLSGKPWPLRLKAVVEGVTLRADGTVDDIKAFHGLHINLAAEGNELAEVIRKAGVELSNLPESIGPFAVSAKLKDKGKQFSLNDVDLNLGKKELAEVRAQGTVTDLAGTVTPDLKVMVDCENPAVLAPIANADIPIKGPLHISGNVKGSDKQWTVSELEFVANKSDLKGTLHVQLAKRPAISGQLASSFFDLADVTASSTAAPAQAPEKKAAKSKGDGRLFSDQPLPLAPLRSVDADVKLHMAKLKLDDRQLNDLDVHVALNGGRLAVAPFSFGLAGGTFEGKVHLDGSAKTPTLAVLVNGRGFELGKLQNNSALTGGKSDLKVDLQSSGNSVRALMASATGETVVSVGQGRLMNKAVNWAAGDLIFQVLGAINPFSKTEDYTKMSCAAVRFVLRDGLATADNGIAMRTEEVDVVGSGTINLRSERLDLGIKPRARGGVGLSLSSPLAGLVRVNGTLANPSMGIDTVGTLKTAASVGAGVATGGLSTLGEILVDKVVADDDPCQTALGKGKSTQTPQQSQKKKPNKVAPEKQLLQGILGR